MPGPLLLTLRSLSTGRSSYLPVHTPTHQHGRQQCSEKADAEVTDNSSAECAKQTSSTSHHRDAEESDSNMIMLWLNDPSVLAAFVCAYAKSITRGARSWN